MSEFNASLATLASTIKQGVENHAKDLHTAMPGIIQSFDAATQLATVQPAIKRIFITRDSQTDILTPSNLPILINVPVIFPRGGGFSMTFPVAVGDECLLVFCERSIDAWHQFGTVREPGARRFHSLSDATAFVGLSSIPKKVPNYDAANLQIKKDDESVSISLNENGSLTITANQNINISTSANAIITANAIQINGNTTIDGTLVVTQGASAATLSASTSLTVASKEMSNHTHIGSPTAPTGAISNTGVPV